MENNKNISRKRGVLCVSEFVKIMVISKHDFIQICRRGNTFQKIWKDLELKRNWNKKNLENKKLFEKNNFQEAATTQTSLSFK